MHAVRRMHQQRTMCASCLEPNSSLPYLLCSSIEQEPWSCQAQTWGHVLTPACTAIVAVVVQQRVRHFDCGLLSCMLRPTDKDCPGQVPAVCRPQQATANRRRA